MGRRIILASFPGLPRFYLPFAFTIIHGSGRPVLIFVGLPISCIIVNANGSSKRERPGTEARIIVVLCSKSSLQCPVQWLILQGLPFQGDMVH